MNNTLYYVEFKGTPAEGKGTVTQSDHKGWHKMDHFSGAETFREVDGAKVGVANQTDRNPIRITDIVIAAEKCSAAPHLHQMHFNSSVIPTLTIHRMRSDNKKLVVDEEIIVENARIKTFSNQDNFTHTTISGFSTFQKSYYTYKDDGTAETSRVGYDLAAGEEKQ